MPNAIHSKITSLGHAQTELSGTVVLATSVTTIIQAVLTTTRPNSIVQVMAEFAGITTAAIAGTIVLTCSMPAGVTAARTRTKNLPATNSSREQLTIATFFQGPVAPGTVTVTLAGNFTGATGFTAQNAGLLAVEVGDVKV